MSVEPGIYKHADGGYYYVVETCEVKDNDTGVWMDGVAYRSVDGGRLYVTDLDRWELRFSLAPDAPYEPRVEEDPGRQFQNRSVQDNLALATTIVKALIPGKWSFHQNTAQDQVRWILDRELTRMWDDVVSFHEKYGLAYRGPPRALPVEFDDFRTLFIAEELEEYAETPGLVDWLREALARRGRLEDTLERRENKLDALVDMVYVVFGAAYLHGFNFAEAWRRVQRANMSKVRVEKASDSKRGSTFDVVKPPGWEPPSHKDLVGSMEPRIYEPGILMPAMADNVPEGFVGPEVEVIRSVQSEQIDLEEAIAKAPQHDLF